MRRRGRRSIGQRIALRLAWPLIMGISLLAWITAFDVIQAVTARATGWEPSTVRVGLVALGAWVVGLGVWGVLAGFGGQITAVLATVVRGWVELGRRIKPIVVGEPGTAPRSKPRTRRVSLASYDGDQAALVGGELSTSQIVGRLWDSGDPFQRIAGDRIVALDTYVQYTHYLTPDERRCVYVPDRVGGWTCETHNHPATCPLDGAHLLGYHNLGADHASPS